MVMYSIPVDGRDDHRDHRFGSNTCPQFSQIGVGMGRSISADLWVVA
jgi:hypothetical protein